MTVIKTVVRNRRIEVSAPEDWPEGCEVIIEPLGREPIEGECPKSLPIRDHRAFLNSYEPKGEGLYDDYPSR
jgi:hypothetical protein